MPCTLSSPTLGLDPTTYLYLAQKMTLIIHAAWAVNFTARLRSFVKDHIGGLKNLLDFTLSPHFLSPEAQEDGQQQQQRRIKEGKKKRFLFLSSTASVTSTPPHKQPIAERISENPTDASPLGYSRSKWVAENICARFHAHISSPSPSSSSAQVDMAVLRIGQLTADTCSGIWNMSEAYPLILSTAPVLRALPDLRDTACDWLPVDVAAGAVLEIANAPSSFPTTTTNSSSAITPSPSLGIKNDAPVFHILNPHTSPHWRDLLRSIQQSSPDLSITILPPRKWLAMLERCEKDIPAKRLVGLWRDAFSSSSADRDGDGEAGFLLQRTREVSKTMRQVRALDEGVLNRMWGWVERQ